MSHPSMAGRGVGPGSDTETELTAEMDIEQLLGTLEDPDCRAIIEATSEEAYSASELSDRCDLPLSTAYRKLDALTEVGLLKERIRLSNTGQHTSEYTLQIEHISLTVDDDAGISLTLTKQDEKQAANSMVAGAD
ncbi:helix-turn-helix domain-containing protein [Halovenus amylolytica]|uniref:helix-turn-helix domain-containing protein n=1 Tax=Halovenus amylolytica TaxID=2500550 RepID=UPI003D6BC478